MSEYDDNDGDRGFRRQIRETKEEAFRARRVLRRDLPNPSVETSIEVSTILSDYRDLLSDFADENALRTPWEDRNVDWIDEALAQTTTVERDLPRRGHATEEVEVPKAAAVDAGALLELGKELDAIAKELGFAASAKDTTPGGEATEDDLVDLLTARGQEDALERLPERFKKESGGDST